MAQLKDLYVSGPSRFIGNMIGTSLQIKIIAAPTAAGGSAFGLGTSGQTLVSNGSSIYWGAPDITNATGTLPINKGGTNNSENITTNRVVISTGTGDNLKMFTAANLYATSDSLAINKTSITDTYKFEVNGTSIFDDNITSKQTILFGNGTSSSAGKAILSYSATYPNYGIWYFDETTDSMTFSANNAANSKDDAELKLSGGKVYTKNKIIPHTNNTTGTVGGTGQPVYVNAGAITAITTLSTGYGGTGISESPTANRVVWSNASSQITSSSMYTDGSRLGVNKTSISSTDYKFEVSGKSRLDDLIIAANKTISVGTFTIGGTTTDLTKTIQSSSTMYLTTSAESSIIFSTKGTARGRFEAATGHFRPETDCTADDNGYNIGTSSYRWNYLYARNLNLENSAYIENDLTVNDELTIQGKSFFNDQTAVSYSNSTWVAANIFKGGTLFNSTTDATTHTTDGALVVLGGVNIAKTLRTAGDLILKTADVDRSIIFGYDNATTVSANTNKSWRIAYLGSGANNTGNYLVVDTSTENNTWTRVMRAAMDTLDVGFGNAIAPLITYDSSTHISQNIGQRNLVWSDLFVNRANVNYIQPYSSSSVTNVNNIIEIQGYNNGNINTSAYLETTQNSLNFYPYEDLKGTLGDSDHRWKNISVGEFVPDYIYAKTSGTVKKDEWLTLFAGAQDGSNLENGTYAVQLCVGTTASTQAFYSGICSWIKFSNQDTTFTKYSEIPLHGVKAGLANEFFLRTAIDVNGICMQISQSSSSNTALNTSTNKIVVKMKKIM